MISKIHQNLLHQGKRVLRKIHQSLLLQMVEEKTKITCQENSDSYNTDLNAKKVHIMKQGAVGKNMWECVII